MNNIFEKNNNIMNKQPTRKKIKMKKKKYNKKIILDNLEQLQNVIGN